MYSWKKSSEPRSYSRTQRLATGNDISNWIKKVEDAHNYAAAETFGIPYSGNEKHSPASAVESLRDNDESQSEAQELLTQWMNEKVAVDEDMYDFDAGPSRNDIRQQWDDMLNKNSEVDYQIDDDYDEGTATASFMKHLRNKPVVKPSVLEDLGMNPSKNHVDPRTKMQLRHQQVKENREKRERELQSKKKEKQHQKEVQTNARQIIMKEDRDKMIRKKKEEDSIQKEATRLRKELEEQRRKDEDERKRKLDERLSLERKLREERELEQIDAERKLFVMSRLREERIREDARKLEMISVHEKTRNLRTMQRYFSAWYNVVLEKRIQLGRAKAMSDWRSLVTAFNGWKAYTRAKRVERDTVRHEIVIKDNYRKMALATEHYNHKILRRCLMAWLFVGDMERKEAKVELEQQSTRNKMSAFLEAAASGKLWKDQNTPRSDVSSEVSARESPKSTSRSKGNRGDDVEDFFNQNSQKKTRPDSARSDLTTITSRSDTSVQKIPIHKRGPQVPREAWQVTPETVKLTKDQIGHLGLNSDLEGEQGQGDCTLSPPKSPSKEPFKPDIYENRNKAQISILKQQQKQIKEQQRMIEDMQFAQKQQTMQQQLAQQQVLLKQLEEQKIQPEPIPIMKEPLNRKYKTAAQLATNAVDRGRTNSADGSTSARSNASTAISSVSTKASKRDDEFVKGMTQRAEDRARLKAEREGRRRKEEEEKFAVIKAEQEEERRKEEDAKKLKLDALREKRRVEKQKEMERIKEAENMKELSSKADEHYKKMSTLFRGLLPWKRFVDTIHENEKKAIEFYNKNLAKRAYETWNEITLEVVEEKEKRADELYESILLRRCFRNWRHHGEQFLVLEQKADTMFRRNLLWKVIRAWHEHTEDEKFRMWELERRAKEYNACRSVKTCFRAWKKFPALMKREKQKEGRLLEMRRKVAAMLPDYDPNRESL